MAAPKRKQHYVARCYLQPFADPSTGLVNVLSLLRKKNYTQKPENILTENHMYTIKLTHGGGSFVVEDTLANIEGKYAKIFEEKLSKRLPLTAEERVHLSVFVAATLERTKQKRNNLTNFINKTIEMTKKMEEAKNLPKSDLREQLESFAPNAHAAILYQNLPFSSQLVHNLKFCFVSPKNKKLNFLTSSRPCVIYSPSRVEAYGFKSIYSSPGFIDKDLELTLPLSPSLALMGGYDLKAEGIYMDVPDDLIESINKRTMLYSDEYVISSTKEQLEEIIKLLK